MGEQLYDLNGVPIFSVGKWNNDSYAESDLDAMVAAYAQVGWKPPLKLGHDAAQKFADGMPALGWVENLRRVGGQLVADFTQMPRKVWEAIKRKAYNRVSAEVYWDYTDGGKRLPRVLKAVALLGADIPAVTNLGTLEALYDQRGQPFKTYDFGLETAGCACAPTPYPPMQSKKGKADVGYALGGEDKFSRCGTCKFFLGPPTTGDADFIGSCTIVEGEVASSFACDLQEPREAYKAMSKTVVKTHQAEPITEPQPKPKEPTPEAPLSVKPDASGMFCVFKGDQKVQCFPTQEEADALLTTMTDTGAEPKAEEPAGNLPPVEIAPTQPEKTSLKDKLALAGDAVKAVAGVLDALDKGLSGTDLEKVTPEEEPNTEEKPDAEKPEGDEEEELGPDGKPKEKKPAFPGAKPFAERQRSYVIERAGRKFVLRSKTTGKVLGEHDSYDAAMAQEMAIQASKRAAYKLELTAEQMEPLCKSCAEKMRRDNVRAYKFFLGPTKVFGVEPGVPLGKVRYFAVGPNADALCEKFGEDEGFFTRCQEHMSGQKGLDNPEGFCAELHKYCTGKYPAEKTHVEAAPAKPVGPPRYVVEQRPSGLWDLARETGKHVATYATEAEAREALGRLERKS